MKFDMHSVRTFSINLRIMTSDSPLEYMFAVSMVLIPASQAALRTGKAYAGSAPYPQPERWKAHFVLGQHPGLYVRSIIE